MHCHMHEKYMCTMAQQLDKVDVHLMVVNVTKIHKNAPRPKLPMASGSLSQFHSHSHTLCTTALFVKNSLVSTSFVQSNSVQMVQQNVM